MSENIVALHVLHDSPPEFLQRVVGNGALIDALAEEGLQPVITTRGAFTRNLPVLQPYRQNDAVAFAEVPMDFDGIVAIRNHVLADFKDTVPAPIINANAVKQVARQDGQMRAFYKEWSIPSYSIDGDTSHAEVRQGATELAEQGEGMVLFMPVDGRTSKGVAHHNLGDALSYIDALFARHLAGEEAPQVVMQPYLGKLSLPESVSGATVAAQAALDVARAEKRPAELRNYTIRNHQSTTVVPVVRIGGPQDAYLGSASEQYYPVVLNSEAQAAVSGIASTVTHRLSNATGVPYVLGATDMVQFEGSWRVMHPHFRSPDIATPEEIGESALQIYQALATTLRLAAQARNT